ncbi:MAG: putative cytosolic protein, partial [Candidatus Dadabacteria bacterium]|nr:putative cytosolic protein [Candidatus Dadabacteria bacterium]
KANEFREALTSASTIPGFSSRLIEKDYYCSLILHDFEPLFQQGIVFKGGTCLSKIHAGFYRLSEDLDFAFSIEPDAKPSNRRNMMKPVKNHIKELCIRQSCFSLKDSLIGHNNSKQYVGRYSYNSVISGENEFIKIEIGLREQILEPVKECKALTILTNPFRDEPAILPVSVNALTMREAYAEKFRAAMTRRIPTIRDFYDIDYAIRTGKLDTAETKLLELVRHKLAVPDNDPIDISGEKLSTLRTQLETQLKPVLRNSDYESFDLDRAFDIVKKLRDSL